MVSIDVTRFIQTCSMRDFSASVAEIGTDAGPATWRASLEESEEFDFLPTPELLQEFREWLKPWGGWSEEEIAAMSDDHLRAHCVSNGSRETGASVSIVHPMQLIGKGTGSSHRMVSALVRSIAPMMGRFFGKWSIEPWPRQS